MNNMIYLGMKKINLMLLSLGFLLVSCGGGTSESQATSDSTGTQIVPTSDISVDIFLNNIRMSNIVTGEDLRLGGGDALQVSADGTPVVVTEVQQRACNTFGLNCRYVYHYKMEFPASAYATYQQINIAFIRANGVSALNTVINIPPLPIYSAPLQNSTFSLANDDIPINIYHASFYNTYDLIVAALLDTGITCIYRLYVLDSGQSDFVIPAGTIVDNAGCLGNVVASKVFVKSQGVVVADPAFDSVYLYDLYSDSGVDINLNP